MSRGWVVHHIPDGVGGERQPGEREADPRGEEQRDDGDAEVADHRERLRPRDRATPHDADDDEHGSGEREDRPPWNVDEYRAEDQHGAQGRAGPRHPAQAGDRGGEVAERRDADGRHRHGGVEVAQPLLADQQAGAGEHADGNQECDPPPGCGVRSHVDRTRDPVAKYPYPLRVYEARRFQQRALLTRADPPTPVARTAARRARPARQSSTVELRRAGGHEHVDRVGSRVSVTQPRSRRSQTPAPPPKRYSLTSRCRCRARVPVVQVAARPCRRCPRRSHPRATSLRPGMSRLARSTPSNIVLRHRHRRSGASPAARAGWRSRATASRPASRTAVLDEAGSADDESYGCREGRVGAGPRRDGRARGIRCSRRCPPRAAPTSGCRPMGCGSRRRAS